ncbi:MAG: iron transporter substrate-binding protein [Rhodospirillales bacterium]|nr:iron transporter substrate-binding protein [Rhodospirillales bacterium]
MSIRIRILVLALVAVLVAADASARTFIDGAGRRVELPDKITRVLAAGPPASVAVYALAPDKLVGWVNEFPPAARPFIAKPYIDLPVHGRLTGRANTVNMEIVLTLKPDIIVDVGSIDATYASLADKVQEQTGIPYVLIGGAFAKSAETLRTLGDAIDATPRAIALSAYAESTLNEVAKIASVPQDKRPRVYYGRGPAGLETGLAGSINLQVLEAVGAINVAAAAGKGGLTNVSMEQILAWSPDIVIAQDRNFFAHALIDPVWKGVPAVRARRVYHAPELPWGWFDSPPGINRLIGVRWLAATLYPDRPSVDLRTETREFYKLFYHVDLTDAQVNDLLKDATALK